MEQRQITISFLPTPLAETVIRRKWIAGAQFKRLLTGGDRLRQVACDGQSFDLINHYGPTENSVVTTSAIVDAQSQVLPPIGRPIMNTRVYVVGADWQPVTLGVPGELAIAGRGLARYYLAHPALTAEKFIPNPYGAPGERLYLSGDLVRYRNDGRIDFVGRLDTQVKIRGYRIELGEIEAALKSHPEVGESIVIAQDGARESPRLIAYIVTKRETWNCEDLRNYLKDKLPEYMVPAGFVKLQKFPLTPHGKVDLKALPTPETSRIGLDQDYIPPRTEIERTIAAIWKEVLGISEIGIGDNFFDRGGNSLLAVRMAERLRDKLPVKVSVVDIFKHPTISAQAAFVRPIQNEQQFFQPILERVRLRKQAIDL
jgi:acyl-CoA synthetase (AMP-forming)/AMP-acid ligase II